MNSSRQIQLVRRYRTRILFFVVTFLPIAGITSSCSKNQFTVIEETDISRLPSMTVKNFTTQYSDSGKLSMVMSAPIMETYSEEDPGYSEFKEGIKVIFYDGKDLPAATVNSKYAKFLEKDNLWELRDSVVVYSDNGNTLETEQLFWEQGEKDRIYTDRFVKIVSDDQTIMGNGFESDSRLTKRRIKKVTATLYVSTDEQ